MRTVQLQCLGLLVLAHIGAVALGQTTHSLTLVSAGAFYSLRVSDLEVSDDLRVARWEVSYEWEHYTRSNQSYRFAILRVAYDCAEQRYASLSEELYADRPSSTPLRSASNDMAHLSWSEAKPGSIEDRQLRAVCETHSTTARAA
jgi:hypothetical protein